MPSKREVISTLWNDVFCDWHLENPTGTLEEFEAYLTEIKDSVAGLEACQVDAAATQLLLEQCEDALAAESAGQVYYVSEATGNDVGPGTEAEPFATIQKGLDSLTPGSVLKLTDAEYRVQAPLTPPVNGNNERSIIIDGQGAEILGSVKYDDWDAAPEYGANFYKHAFVDWNGDPLLKTQFPAYYDTGSQYDGTLISVDDGANQLTIELPETPTPSSPLAAFVDPGDATDTPPNNPFIHFKGADLPGGLVEGVAYQVNVASESGPVSGDWTYVMDMKNGVTLTSYAGSGAWTAHWGTEGNHRYRQEGVFHLDEPLHNVYHDVAGGASKSDTAALVAQYSWTTRKPSEGAQYVTDVDNIDILLENHPWDYLLEGPVYGLSSSDKTLAEAIVQGHKQDSAYFIDYATNEIVIRLPGGADANLTEIAITNYALNLVNNEYIDLHDIHFRHFSSNPFGSGSTNCPATASKYSRVTNCSFSLNTGGGFNPNDALLVSGCQAELNGLTGFSNGAAESMRLCLISKNNWKSGVWVIGAGGGYKVVTNFTEFGLQGTDKDRARTIEFCDFTENYGAGCWVDIDVNNILVRHNNCSMNAGSGIYIETSGKSRGGTVYGNYCYSNGGAYHGFGVGSFTSSSVSNKDAGIKIAESQNIICSRNICINNDTGITIRSIPGRTQTPVGGPTQTYQTKNVQVVGNAIINNFFQLSLVQNGADWETPGNPNNPLSQELVIEGNWYHLNPDIANSYCANYSSMTPSSEGSDFVLLEDWKDGTDLSPPLFYFTADVDGRNVFDRQSKDTDPQITDAENGVFLAAHMLEFPIKEIFN